MLEPVVRENLRAFRGADFGPYGWLLNDLSGDPLTDPDGIVVTAKVFMNSEVQQLFTNAEGAETALVVSLSVPGVVDPQVAVLLQADSSVTSEWDWKSLPYQVMVARAGREDTLRKGLFIVEGAS